MKFPELIEKLISVGANKGGAADAVLYRIPLTKASTLRVLDVINDGAIRVLD